MKDGNLLRSLATCHSLTRYDGLLTGDPLDIKMFETTKWKFIDEHVAGTCKFEQVTPVVKQSKKDNDNPIEIAIVKQFTFSSSVLRMSVLCRALDRNYMDVYTKGAPEKIVELCRKETVPHDFSEMLKIYAANGYRVIALAGKALDPSISWMGSLKMTRDSIESDLTFYGFLIMQNMIKPETTPIIAELTNSAITTVMVTGDNLLTALCVARKCGMVPKNNKVIFVEAHPPEEPTEHDGPITSNNYVPARIEWKMAEESVDLDHLELNNNYQSSYPVRFGLKNFRK